jgi:hypothetical protein
MSVPDFLSPAHEALVLEPSGTEGASARERRCSTQRRLPSEAEDADVRTDFFESPNVGHVGRIVNEASEVDAMAAREMPEQVPGTDLVALVRRIRNSVGKE